MGSKGHTLCRVMVGLWIVTLAVAGWMFVAGWTKPGTDGRQEIGLAPAGGTISWPKCDNFSKRWMESSEGSANRSRILRRWKQPQERPG